MVGVFEGFEWWAWPKEQLIIFQKDYLFTIVIPVDSQEENMTSLAEV